VQLTGARLSENGYLEKGGNGVPGREGVATVFFGIPREWKCRGWRPLLAARETLVQAT